MGSMLPKPVESVLIERHTGKGFRVAVAEVNGWRNNMEDAHLIHMCDNWGFFGVFDGHGGDQCSAFVADRMHKRLCTSGCPQDDAAVKKLILGVDKEFLDTKQDSGSTGTMCIVHRPAGGGDKYSLRLANVGDSRVLLGHRDGRIAKGPGTDQGLTTDHKPEHPSERERIYRCGGHVATGEMGGPARVNGELSVSRCFGDARFKETGGPGPEDHPVTADPELGSAECNGADFLLLVCDGVSEGDFPNAEVVKLVAGILAKTDDPGAAAQAVCHKAIEAGSKDNVTCMMVLFDGDKVEKNSEYAPGPLSGVTNKAFMTAYEAMAKRAGLTLAQAAEMRHDIVVESLSRGGMTHKKIQELKAESAGIGSPAGQKGSSERSAWFRNWEKKLPENMVVDEDEEGLLRYMMARQGLAGGMVGLPKASPAPGSGRRVRISDLPTLRSAVNESSALEWDARMAQLAGAEGRVQEDDPSDGTSQVCCEGMTAWLPTSTLSDYDEAASKGRTQRNQVVTPGGTQRANAGLPPTVPTPARLDQRPWQGPPGPQGPAADPSVRKAAGRAPRGSSPQTPNSSASLMSQSGARLITAQARLPTLGASGRVESGYRAPSPGGSAGGLGMRTLSPGAAAGVRSNGLRSTGGGRAPSPIDSLVGNRSRGQGTVGRASRSVPPRASIV